MKDIVLYNGKVYGNPAADAVLISGNSIKHVGSRAECMLYAKAGAETIDLKGHLLLPAFTDAHTHFVEYAKQKLSLDLLGCTTIDCIIERMQAYKATMKPGITWVLGGGWDANIIDDPAQLNRHLLDRIFPDIPVALWSKDYHSKLCNSRALKLAGFDEDTLSPPGGSFHKMADGSLSGILFEKAAELIDPHITQADDALLLDAIDESLQELYRYGIVSFHSMEYYESIKLLRASQARGRKFRLCWHFMEQDYAVAERLGLKSYEGDEWFKLGGLKLFADGTLGSKSAAIYDSYPGDPSNRGVLRYETDELISLARRAWESGFSLTIHAIGDRAVAQSIDSIAALPHQRGALHRIEHIQAIRAQDITRLKEHNIHASLQPVHLMGDIPLILQNWQGIIKQSYPIKSIIESGISYGFGSDSPIESINPFLGIYSAIQRRNYQDKSGYILTPHQRITPEEAIHGYTLGAARLSSSENRRGSIMAGLLADLMLIEDYSRQEGDYWVRAKSLFTMVDGEVVHSEL